MENAFDDTLQVGHTGRMIGKFRLERRLGAGAMGEVFLGVHVELGNAVAVKILTGRAIAEPNGVERFLNEARAVAAIDHENIARVIDQDRLPDGTPYIVMEFVAGETLRDVLRDRGPMPLHVAVNLALDVLAALKAAHDRGVVHRDLKPENIRVTPNGRAKVLDFGIAKRLSTPSTALTAEGAIIGTPHYMSPEQVSAEPLDGRSDLYSLGVILFECVTGQRPFEGESLVALFNRHLTEAPPAPSSLRPDCPPALERVILRALEKSTEYRFSSAEEMTRALRAVNQELPGNSAPTVPIARPSPTLATPKPQRLTKATAPMPRAAAPGRGLVIAGVVAVVGLAGALVTILVMRAPDTAIVVTQPSVVAPAVKPPPTQPLAVEVPAPQPSPVTAPVEVAVAPTEPAKKPRAAKRVGAGKPVELSNVSPPVAVAPAPVASVEPPEANAERPRRKPLLLPVDFDPKNFDALGFLKRAQRLARENMSDAALIDFSVNGVFADGHVDLTLTKGYEADYYFRSPSLSVDDPLVPDGDEEIPCLTYVVVSAKNIEVFTARSFNGCKEKIRPAISCPLPQAAAAALRQGGITTRVAKASWLQDGWYFDYGDEGPSLSVHCP